MASLATEEAQVIVYMALFFFPSFGVGVMDGFRVLARAVGVGVFPEVPKLGRFLLLEFWLAGVAGVLPLLLGLS